MLKNCYRYVSLLAIYLGLSFLLGINLAHAEVEQIAICGKYQHNNYSYSQGYKLTAFWLDGHELNRLSNSYAFNSYDYFIFIPWDEGGFTLLKTERYNKPRSYEQTYQDQRGVNWSIKEGWSSCY